MVDPEMLPNEGAAPNGNGHADVPEMRSLGDVIIDRLMFMRQAGITFGGDRDLYTAFGYDRVITHKQYRDRYARGGIAGRIIDALPNATWRGDVELIGFRDQLRDPLAARSIGVNSSK